ncbi:MAG TPA: DUF2357 domain-containing protein [Xanthobacteraceae bacterium]|nr:DUF2357 domain-containing protein [Xanthobacteraceae bacterium]
MTIAFHYRHRHQGGSDVPVVAGSVLQIKERTEYILTFPQECPPSVQRQIADLDGEMLTGNTVLLGFANFVGEASVAGVVLKVASDKLGSVGCSILLEEISERGSSLVFASRSPLGFRAAPDRLSLAPVPYHQFQYLRAAMLDQVPGRRLQDWLFVVERNPSRRFEQERPVLPLGLVRKLDHRAMASVFNRLDRLVQVPNSSPTAKSRLALALTFGSPPSPHFPGRISSPRGGLTFDTPENRFVRHVIEMCLALVQRFADHPRLHPRLQADCRRMLALLEHFAAQPFIRQASVLSSFTGPSQALAKAPGYREIFEFWREISCHISLPTNAEDTQRLLEGRDIAKLYEYWVFTKVIESTFNTLGATAPLSAAITRDEFGESIAVDVPFVAAPNISVRFNPSFSRTRKTAYSTPLRPDVILQVGGVLHAFDAKYRLDRLDTESALDDADATFKRDDLYKMHTYRDAIVSLRTAFVVYPGTEYVFFDRHQGAQRDPAALHNADGVGAIPLRPSNTQPHKALEETIKKLIGDSLTL